MQYNLPNGKCKQDTGWETSDCEQYYHWESKTGTIPLGKVYSKDRDR